MLPELYRFAATWAPHVSDPEASCRAAGALLQDLAQKRSTEKLSERCFIDAVLFIQTNFLEPIDLTLTVSKTIDGWTAVGVRQKHRHEHCASFEFLPETGEFRHIAV